MTDKADLFRNCIKNVYQKDDVALAIATGTPRPFRKITSMIMDSNGNAHGYAKIGETPLAIERIKNEAKILKVIGNRLWVIGKENTDNGSEVMGDGSWVKGDG